MKLIIFGLVFYLIYFFVRTVFIRPFQEGYANGGSRGARSWQNPFQKEGEVTIISNPKKGKLKDDGVGDYIDYEEVKD